MRSIRLLPVCVLLAATTLLLTPGCDSNSDDDAPDIVGTWERNFVFFGQANNFHLTFNADGTWLFRPAGQPGGFNGIYSLSGRRLTLEDFGCEEGPGQYDVRIVSGRLAFTTIEDPCPRVNLFSGTWGPVE